MSKAVPELDKGGKEQDAQIAIMDWWHNIVANNDVEVPEAALYHIPNGGTRNVIEAKMLKRAGVRSGVPDLFLSIPRGPFHGLYIELKRLGGGKASDNQLAFIAFARAQGYAAYVCHGEKAAETLISEYIITPENLDPMTDDVTYDKSFVIIGNNSGFIY